MDIAKSDTVFYLCFTLPETLPDNDEPFAEFLKDEDLINAYGAGIN